MKPLNIQGRTRILNAPADWKEGDALCSALPIMDTTLPEGPFMVSAWEPNAHELARLKAGAPVYLWVRGKDHPVVQLDVGNIPG